MLVAVAGGSWLLMRPVARLGRRLGLVDRPSSRRVRACEIPTTGGIVVFCSFAAAMLAALRLCGPESPGLALKLGTLLAGGTAVVILGIVDDKRGLRPGIKLAVQAAIAIAMVVGGVGIERMRFLFGPSIYIGWVGYPLTVFWFVAFMNALNMIDGLDGLAGGIVVITSAALFAVGVMDANPVLYFMSAGLLGSTVGFLLHNFRLHGLSRGNVYLGDAGSMVLGFFVAGGSIVGAYNDAASKALLVAAACTVVPAFDLVTTVVRRARKRSALMAPDRSHVHHRLIRFGLSPARAVIVLWGITVFVGGQVLGVVAPFGFIYLLGSYVPAFYALRILWEQRRKNMRTTKRRAGDEVLYLMGLRDTVDAGEGEEVGLRDTIRDQVRREAFYRRLRQQEERLGETGVPDPSPKESGALRGEPSRAAPAGRSLSEDGGPKRSPDEARHPRPEAASRPRPEPVPAGAPARSGYAERRGGRPAGDSGPTGERDEDRNSNR